VESVAVAAAAVCMAMLTVEITLRNKIMTWTKSGVTSKKALNKSLLDKECP
jgi:hypothetical protein